MYDAPTARLLPDGRRLHLGEGPIDLVVAAAGRPEAVAAAYEAAARRFKGLLAELCSELLVLRLPAGRGHELPEGPVASRMHAAVLPFAQDMFITPMAAVAGAVAEEILQAMLDAVELQRAFVNNGGDIALHLAAGERLTLGLVDKPRLPSCGPSFFGRAEIASTDAARGIATSGRHGRSFSLGIADAVTVLAATAAAADAAATVIANAVDLPGHAAISRVPACDVQADSDLGSIPVVRAVGELTPAESGKALADGACVAERLRAEGRVLAAALHLNGMTRVVSASAGPSERQMLQIE